MCFRMRAYLKYFGSCSLSFLPVIIGLLTKVKSTLYRWLSLCFSLMKYADDSYLLVGSSNICSVYEEFAHIKAWAAEKNLQLNPHKTRELIVYRRRAGSSAPLDPFLPGTTRVTSMRVLGVVLSANLTMG